VNFHANFLVCQVKKSARDIVEVINVICVPQVNSKTIDQDLLSVGDVMASECYQGTIPLQPQSTTLPLPLPTARCIPERGICYTSLSHGEGQATAQLGCWPSQTTKHLAWLGVPECKHEIRKLICLCLESLCNGFLPSANGGSSPVFGDLQGLTLTFMILVLLVVVAWIIGKIIKNHTRKDKTDEEQGHDCFSSFLKEDSSLLLSPTSPPIKYGNPAPLFRRSSAPASLPSPTQLKPYTKPMAYLNHDGSRVQMMDRPIIIVGPFVGGPIFKYMDISRTKSFHRPVVEVIKRLDRGEGSGSIQNWAFAQEEEKRKISSEKR